MSEAIQRITSKFEKIYDFKETAEAINTIIKILAEKDPSLDLEFVNMAIKQEWIRKNNAEVEKNKVGRAMEPVYEYLESLIKAAISDMIHKHGNFQIPVGNYDEDQDEDESDSIVDYGEIYDDDIFSAKVQKRYELVCLESYKDDRSDQGWFSLKPAGVLQQLFKKYGLEIHSIEVEFNGAPGDDYVVVTNKREIYESFGQISMSWDKSVTVDGVTAIASELKANPNKNLLIQTIRDSGR